MTKTAIIVELSQVDSLIDFFKANSIKDFKFERVYTEEKEGMRFIIPLTEKNKVIGFLYEQ